MRRIALLFALIVAANVCAAGSASARTTWLCRPGMAHDPCVVGLKTTRFSALGARLGIVAPKRDKPPKIDCFFVYPTVSDQPTVEANRHKDPAQLSAALYQAARYSQHCRIYAPMYRELTLAGTTAPLAAQARAVRRAYADVLAAWRVYLARYNHGRGFVLLGHSQGSAMLKRLIKRQIDGRPGVRRRLVSAILLGGNVVVPKGRDVGGDFHHIRACRSPRQLGCVIAYSSFDAVPPQNALFGRAGGPLAAFFDEAKGRDLHALCTNPAALAGGPAPLDTVFPTKPIPPGTRIAQLAALLQLRLPSARTPWIELRHTFFGRCRTTGRVTYLSVTPAPGVTAPKPSLDATWGLHLIDSGLTQGNLAALIGREARAYLTRR
jgi:hypothetical protein